jgi:hypothetical protein
MQHLLCAQFVDLLGDYCDGALEHDQCSAMDGHRLACPSCERLHEEYGRIPALIRRATHIAMPAAAQARLRRLLVRAWRRRA